MGDYMPFQSQYQCLSSERWCENILCQTEKKKRKITFCSISEGKPIYFLKNASFCCGSFQVHLHTFRCALPTRKLYFSFFLWGGEAPFCSDVFCVSYFNCISLFFCYHGFKWKIKTPEKDLCVWSLLAFGAGLRD